METAEDSEDETIDDYKVGGYHPVHVGEVFLQRYIVIQKLGWGHFSTVWLAKDLKYNTYVALKVQKSAPHYLEAAFDEVEILEQVSSYWKKDSWIESARHYFGEGGRSREPNMDSCFCVQLLNSFLHYGPNGKHFVMVFEIMGVNLLDIIRRYDYKGIPIPLVRIMAKQVLIGLDYLHRICKIIHTDLKPENVLLSLTPEQIHEIRTQGQLGKRIKYRLPVNICGDLPAPPVPPAIHKPPLESAPPLSIKPLPAPPPLEHSKAEGDKLPNVLRYNPVTGQELSEQEVLAKQRKVLKKKRQRKRKKQRNKGAPAENSSKPPEPNSSMNTTTTTLQHAKEAKPEPEPEAEAEAEPEAEPEAEAEAEAEPEEDKKSMHADEVKKEPEEDEQEMPDGPKPKPATALQQSDRKALVVPQDAELQKPRSRSIPNMAFNPELALYTLEGPVDEFAVEIEEYLRTKEQLPRTLQPTQEPAVTKAETEEVKQMQQHVKNPIDEHIRVKIVDLGNGCWTYHHFTSQIQTRQYRSPEVASDLMSRS